MLAEQSKSSKTLAAQRGSTLIEVLIAVLVLSLGLLGALKLQVEGVRLNSDSRYTVLASTFAHDAMDALAFDRFNDKTTWTGIVEGTVASSLSEGRAREWLVALQRDLPDGKAAVGCVNKACSVLISWTPPGRDKVTARYDMYDN